MNRVIRILQFIIIGAMILSLIEPASIAGQETGSKLHPALIQMVQENPDGWVGVIIQKADASNKVEKAVEKLGGVVTKDLYIIHAIAAELPANKVAALSKLASVSWVSLDAPTIYVSGDGLDDDELEEAVVVTDESSTVVVEYEAVVTATDVVVAEATAPEATATYAVTPISTETYAVAPVSTLTYSVAPLSTVSYTAVPVATVSDVNAYDAMLVAEPTYPSVYLDTIGVSRLRRFGVDGEGVTVAVLDSGVPDPADLMDEDDGSFRLLDWVQITQSDTYDYRDTYGHGSHIAGIIGGLGVQSDGEYAGVAPDVNLVAVKVMNDEGASLVSDVVAGMQWVLERKDALNIRVLNLSLNSSVPESYHTSPLCAAAEILWFNGVVVVVSSGNNGSTNPGVLLPPANDPFVITVGAYDDQGTRDRWDDQAASFTGYGVNENGNFKPDVLAPGVDIISLRGAPDSALSTQHPDHIVGEYYFRMSGTSMAAAVVSGAAAALLQVRPFLNPDQVKYRLTNFDDRPLYLGNQPVPTLNLVNAVFLRRSGSANTGAVASQLLWTGDEPVAWDSVSWNSVSWNSVSWNSVSWNSVSWNSVSWNSVSWNSAFWGE